MKRIKTHEELLKLDGRRVACEIEGVEILDAKIRVEDEEIHICQDLKDGKYCEDKLGYEYSWCISDNRESYEKYNRYCINIRLIDSEKTEDKKEIEEFKKTCELTEVQEAIIKVCDDLKEFVLSKNISYGNSALEPVRIFSKANPVEQIKVRIDDKLSRMMKGNGDFEEDTVIDLAGYLVLLKVAELIEKK